MIIISELLDLHGIWTHLHHFFLMILRLSQGSQDMTTMQEEASGWFSRWHSFLLPINLFFFFFNFTLFYSTILYWFLPYINMNPPRVYTCSPSWTPLPPPSPYHLSGSSQCTSPKHPVSCIEPGLAIHFKYDIIHVSMPFSQIIPLSPYF